VWLNFRFTLSIRDVEELLAQLGIEASREAVRCWVSKFGPLIAANLRRRRSPSSRWRLDEMVVKVGGRKLLKTPGVQPEAIVTDKPRPTEQRRESSAWSAVAGLAGCDPTTGLRTHT